MKFTRPVCIVVGPGGIGTAVAGKFISSGWDAILCTRRQSRVDTITRILRPVCQGGADLHFCVGDALLPPSELWTGVAGILREHKKQKQQDSHHVIPRVHLVVCTGGYTAMNIFDMSEANLNDDIAGHVIPALATVKFAKKLFEKTCWNGSGEEEVILHPELSKCDVTLIGSTLSHEGCIDASSYIIAKHALLGLHRAVECDAFGHPLDGRIHFVTLDNVDTPLWGSHSVPENAMAPSEAAETVYNQSIIGREITVGVVMLKRKVKKLKLDTLFAEAAKKRNIRLKFVELSYFRRDDGDDIEVEFDMILHKLTDFIAAGDEYMNDFHKYCRNNQGVILLDDLSNVEILLAREWMAKTDAINIPKTAILRKGEDHMAILANLKLPLLLKPLAACGKELSHKLVLVNKKSMFPVDRDVDYVAQEYINHSGRLYKCYVIGNRLHVIAKRSIRDMLGEGEPDGMGVINFDSQHPISANPALKCENSDENASLDDKTARIEHKAKEIQENISDRLHLFLYGFDLVQANTGEFYVVDINYFPGYHGVPSFHDELADLMRMLR